MRESESEDWMAAWKPMIAAVGTDFWGSQKVIESDPVDRSAIRRTLEPLEFDCALHSDPEVARAYGYADVIVPYTHLASFSIPQLWQPGETLFDSAERDAQPLRSGVSGVRAGLEPPTATFFAADYAAEYVRPATVGDRLRRVGAKLLACVPKETKVGRGAFLTWESQILNQRDELVATLTFTFYRYNPHAR